MTTIIAGGFTASDAAERAMQHLIAAGVNEDNLCSFRVNPPGEHDGLPTGGDRSESPGATEAGGGAVKGAAIGAVAGAAAGAVAATVLGPVAIAGGAGVGAYTGALVGALGSMDPGTHRDEMRPAENLVAVNVDAGDIRPSAPSTSSRNAAPYRSSARRARGLTANGPTSIPSPRRISFAPRALRRYLLRRKP